LSIDLEFVHDPNTVQENRPSPFARKQFKMMIDRLERYAVSAFQGYRRQVCGPPSLLGLTGRVSEQACPHVGALKNGQRRDHRDSSGPSIKSRAMCRRAIAWRCRPGELNWRFHARKYRSRVR